MPGKIYLDKGCTKPFPFKLPPLERRKVHGIIVALGAGEACKAFFGEGIGSLMISPEIKGEQHLKGEMIAPFAVGDIDPDGPFIHVLDDATLDIVMGELDTVTDFTAYLTKKVELIRSGKLLSAGGEEDLVAYYLVRMNPQGQHDFTRPDGQPLGQGEFLHIATGQYEQLQNDPQYIAKRDADRQSYVWDDLIKTFTGHMIAGTSIAVDGQPFVLSDSEEAVRHMALVPRFTRRLLGKSIVEVYEKGRNKPRYTRSFLPGNLSADEETGFFFMTLAVPERGLPDGYDQYRTARRRMLEVHALSLLEKYPVLKRVVGIATEPATKGGSSEDVIFVRDIQWTPRLRTDLAQGKALYGIMQDKMIEQHMDEWEYPPVEPYPPHPKSPAPPGMNRKQRRAIESAGRRRR
jgi:hypothetical protein